VSIISVEVAPTYVLAMRAVGCPDVDALTIRSKVAEAEIKGTRSLHEGDINFR
jgi:hypothetical protein